jgi:hypothetical protein
MHYAALHYKLLNLQYLNQTDKYSKQIFMLLRFGYQRLNFWLCGPCPPTDHAFNVTSLQELPKLHPSRRRLTLYTTKLPR